MVKRRGIQDDIFGGVRRIVSPWLGAPPTQPRQVTRAQGVARAAAEGLDQTFAGGMVKAGVQGDRALARQAAINAAALGTGYIAGKAVQTAAGAVAKTGVPARISNKLRGEMVLLHGSPVYNLKEIKPSLSPYAKQAGYTTPEAYAINPLKSRDLTTAWLDASDYAQLSGSGVRGVGGGSVYIVKGKTSGFTSPSTYPVISSSQNLRVVKEYRAINGPSNFTKDLKRAGYKFPKRK